MKKFFGGFGIMIVQRFTLSLNTSGGAESKSSLFQIFQVEGRDEEDLADCRLEVCVRN